MWKAQQIFKLNTPSKKGAIKFSNMSFVSRFYSHTSHIKQNLFKHGEYNCN